MTNGSEESRGKDFVQITVDGKSIRIHRGRQSVTDIKKLGSVPAAFVLEQVVDGTLHPLADSDFVVIKGGEVFVSHPRDSSSS